MAKLHLREKTDEPKSKFGLGQKTAKMKMVLAEAGDDKIQLTNNAFAMSAKDGEYVEFASDCICEGQVEVWLNRLMSTMRSTIRYHGSCSYIKINILKINNNNVYSASKFRDA
jgi:hypothetical protein